MVQHRCPASRGTLVRACVPLLVALVACSPAPASAPATSPSSISARPSSAPLAGSFADLSYTLEMPAGWVFGTSSGVGDYLSALEASDPALADRVQRILSESPSFTSEFLAYDLSSEDQVTPSVSCNTLDRRSMPVEETLNIAEQQNLDGISELPGIVGSPEADRLTLPVGETVRIRWRIAGPASDELASIGYLFVSGPTVYTCVFTSSATTVGAHEPEWEAILRTFETTATWSVTATIAVGVKPFYIATAAGAVWVANADDGTVTRIDPASNTVVATIDLHGVGLDGGSVAPFGIAGDDDLVWVSSFGFDDAGNEIPGTLTALDTATNQEIGSVPVGRTPFAVTAGFGSVWVVNQTDGTVSRIDRDTRSLVASIAVGDRPGSVAASADSIWVANVGDGTLVRIDPPTNTVVATIEVDVAALAVVVGTEGIWVSGLNTSVDDDEGLTEAEARVYRIDPATNRIAARLETGSDPFGLAANDGVIWVAESMTTSILEIDEASAQVLEEVSLDTNSWGIAVLEGAVWIVQPAAADQRFAAHSPGTVTRLDR